MYGKSIFGSDVAANADPSASAPVGSLVPVDARFPLVTHTGTQIDLSRVARRLAPVGTVNVPVGARVPVDAASAITTHLGERIPITNEMVNQWVIGKMRDPRPGLPPAAERAFWNAWTKKYYPGIFHRPPYVGQRRYIPQHEFGPPSLEGFRGFRGLGAGPDGLGGLIGIR